MRYPERHSEEEKYALANEIIDRIRRTAKCETVGIGMENLPKEGGYVIYPNHQGKYDVLGIFNTHHDPCTFVMDEKKSHMILVAEFLGMLRGKGLKMNDLRQTITIFGQMVSEIVGEGRKYILFPEGGYKENNRNIVESFKPGSFKVAKMSKAPIVPVALVDSYKVFNSPNRGAVRTYVYYLEPIYYEEYAKLKTTQIARMVEDRIKEKIAEHVSAHN